MANTYTQLIAQIAFAVKGRDNLIMDNIRESLEKYICGIVSHNRSKPLAIYCNPDHTHILIGFHPTISVAVLAGDIKASSSKWINENKLVNGRFSWQEGYGAFTYSKLQIDAVAKYILSQPEHHARKRLKRNILISFKSKR